jgi:hypothetical protein
MTESQIERIRKAEEAMLELKKVAAQIRQEIENLSLEDAAARKESLETAGSLEAQAEQMKNTLREWREDIH